MALVECLARRQKTARQEPPAETTRPDHAVQANCVLRGLHAALRGLHAGARKWRAASAVFDASAWHAAGQRNALPAGGITRARRWVRRDTGGVFVVPDALSGRAGNRRGSRSRGNRPTRETPGTLPARCGSIPGFPGWACCATNRSGGDAQRFAKPRPSRPRSWHGACHRCPCDAASFDRRVRRSADPPVRAPLPGADLAVQRQAPLATLAPAQPGFRPTLPPPDRPHRPDAGQRLRRRLHSGLAPGGGPGGQHPSGGFHGGAFGCLRAPAGPGSVQGGPGAAEVARGRARSPVGAALGPPHANVIVCHGGRGGDRRKPGAD